jgi:hypothetical protein
MGNMFANQTPLASRHAARSAQQRPCGNPLSSMTPFWGVAVQHGGLAVDSTPADALYQGVFVSGHQPLWLLAHRGVYVVHEMDSREMAAAGSGVPAAVPIAAMCGWHHSATGRGFVVVTGGLDSCELRFCRMPRNVRFSSSPPRAALSIFFSFCRCFEPRHAAVGAQKQTNTHHSM